MKRALCLSFLLLAPSMAAALSPLPTGDVSAVQAGALPAASAEGSGLRGGRQLVAAAVTVPGAPKDVQAFLERVFNNLPKAGQPITEYTFKSWEVQGKPTEEGVGIMPVAGVNPEKLIGRVMNVDQYVGNIDHVLISKSIKDATFQPPKQVRFYQQVDISPIGKVQQDLVLVDAGTVNGFRLAYWYLLKDKTDALSTDKGARSQYNVGAWLSAPGVVGYALSSAPKREDVNWVQWKALTTGANVAASSVIKNNIEGMSRWSKK